LTPALASWIRRRARRHALIAAAVFAAVLGPASAALAQSYPSKPVHIIVPYPAGGPVDILGRVLAQKLSETMGQPFVVDDKPGASGTLGSDLVAKAPPDGYTLVVGNNATHATNESLYPNLPYQTLRDFAPIGLVATVTNIAVVHPSLPVRSIAELIAYAKVRPGQLNYASSGSGSAAHLTGEMFKLATGTDIVHVPYRGAAPAATDLLAGQGVALMFASAPTVVQYVQAGSLRALAVTGPARWRGLPDVPTMIESGLAGFTSEVWFGILAPAGTPRPIVDRLNAEIVSAAKTPEVSDKLAAQGFDMTTDTPDQFRTFLAAEVAKWGKVVRDSGAKVD
jgi:tripartite-type tricarboxylate transporter receptor subunit TctC